MLDPEFKTFLSRRYGLRGNHISILDFVSEKPGEPVLADEIWRSTGVPKGRVYQFLNDLVGWGFIEVEYGKPKKYRFRQPQEALKAAAGRKEQELQDIERESAEIVERMKWIGAQPGLEVKLISDSQKYYQRLREVVTASPHLKIMARRGILFLPSRRVDVWRRRYYETLLEKIKGGTKVEYLLSLDSFMEALREKESIDEVIEEVEKILEYENADVRYVEKEGGSMVVSASKVLLGFLDPVEMLLGKAVLIDSAEVGKVFHDTFDSVFAGAKKVDRAFVEQLGMM